MKVLKKINNNAAICTDNNGNELIAFGTGIGFPKTPYELKDLTKIKRTYYGVNPEYVGLLTEISQSIFNVSAQIVDYATSIINVELNPNIVFTLGDHINFVLERNRKKLKVPMPELADLSYLYPKELKIGKYGVNIIDKKFDCNLPEDEKVGIALHIINAETEGTYESISVSDSQILNNCVAIIENYYKVHISRKGFNFNRFRNHLQLLVKRSKEGLSTTSINSELLRMLRTKFPQTYKCSLEVKKELEKSTLNKLSEEEVVYLMLHINRLQSREKQK